VNAGGEVGLGKVHEYRPTRQLERGERRTEGVESEEEVRCRLTD